MDSVLEEVPQDAEFGRLKSSVLKFLIRESTILVVLVMNTIVFMSATLNPEAMAKFGPWVADVDMVCVLYFLFEAALKIWALGRQRYFSNRWNMLDFFIVMASVPVLFSAFIDLPENLMSGILILRFARFLRVLRMVRYVHASKSLIKLRGPIFLLVALVAYKSFLLDTPDMIPQASLKWATNAYQFTIVMASYWLLSRLYGMFDAFVLYPKTLGAEPKLDGLLLAFVRTLVGIACLMTGFIMGLKNIGQDPWTILAGIGIGGMAVAFAAQDTIANMISGVFLFVQRPFKIGEKITITGITGKVVSIGLRSVTLKPNTGDLAIVPNKNFTGNPLLNLEARNCEFSKITLPIDPSATADQLDQARSILLDIAKSTKGLMPFYYATFDRIANDGTYMFDLSIFIKRWQPEDAPKYPDEGEKLMNLPSEVKIEIVRRFAAAGIALRRHDTVVLPN